MENCKMFYEDECDLMVKLRPYVCGDRIDVPMSNVVNRKWFKVLTHDRCDARPQNPLLDAYLNGRNAFALLIIADVLHNLKLSVSFEMFKTETGFDPFDQKNTWACAEINRLRCESGADNLTALIEPLMWKLTDLQCHSGNLSRKNYVSEVWKELGINPEDTLVNVTTTSVCMQESDSEGPARMRVTRRTRSATPKRRVPLYKKVSSADLLGICN